MMLPLRTWWCSCSVHGAPAPYMVLPLRPCCSRSVRVSALNHLWVLIWILLLGVSHSFAVHWSSKPPPFADSSWSGVPPKATAGAFVVSSFSCASWADTRHGYLNLVHSNWSFSGFDHMRTKSKLFWGCSANWPKLHNLPENYSISIICFHPYVRHKSLRSVFSMGCVYWSSETHRAGDPGPLSSLVSSWHLHCLLIPGLSSFRVCHVTQPLY